MTDRFFLFGAGYSCRAFARHSTGGASISGTTRSADNFDALRKTGIAPFLFDGTELSPDLVEELGTATHLIASIAPDDGGDPVLPLLRRLGPLPNLRWIGYLSTVGVYGDHEGAWVDETSQCRPVSRRSVLRVDAERDWLAFGEERSLPTAVFRLSGIYGPGRNAFVNLDRGTARRLVKPGQVFNRIHVDDIAGALWLLAGQGTGGIYNVTDDEPAPPQDVVAFAAGLMGREPPAEQDFATAELSPMARSFYGENKRVSNAAIKAEGYSFLYADYRVAHAAMWADGSWQGGGMSDGRASIREG